MRNFACRALLAGLLVCFGAGCSDDDPEEGGGEVVPSVKIENPSVSENSVTFTIVPENAESCAYVYYAESAEAQSAEQILASGTPVDADKSSTVTISDLEYDTKYYFVAAVKSTTGNVAVASVDQTTSGKPVTDLGDPANTYMVFEAGDYEFSAKKVSGETIEGIVSADWIWATKSDAEETEQQLVSNVSYADGKVRFTATGNRGNAAIVAFDAQKNVVWEWLIWCTEQPGEMEFASGGVFMDRTLGAMGSKREDGEKAQSLITYQWGRSTPIISGYADESESEGTLFNEARKWTVMNPDYPFGWAVEKRAVTLEAALAMPTVFFIGDRGDWLAGRANLEENTRQWGAKKTDYDPCPAGYKLPVPADWGDFAEKLDRSEGTAAKGVSYTYNGKTSWIPATVERMYDTGEAVCGFAHTFFWNGTPLLYDSYGFVQMGLMTIEDAYAKGFADYFASRVVISFDPNSLAPDTESVGNWSFSQSVRCVKIQ